MSLYRFLHHGAFSEEAKQALCELVMLLIDEMGAEEAAEFQANMTAAMDDAIDAADDADAESGLHGKMIGGVPAMEVIAGIVLNIEMMMIDLSWAAKDEFYDQLQRRLADSREKIDHGRPAI